MVTEETTCVEEAEAAIEDVIKVVVEAETGAGSFIKVEEEAGAEDAINADRLVTLDEGFNGLVLLLEDTGISFKLLDIGITCGVEILELDRE